MIYIYIVYDYMSIQRVICFKSLGSLNRMLWEYPVTHVGPLWRFPVGLSQSLRNLDQKPPKMVGDLVGNFKCLIFLFG